MATSYVPSLVNRNAPRVWMATRRALGLALVAMMPVIARAATALWPLNPGRFLEQQRL